MSPPIGPEFDRDQRPEQRDDEQQLVVPAQCSACQHHGIVGGSVLPPQLYCETVRDVRCAATARILLAWLLRDARNGACAMFIPFDTSEMPDSYRSEDLRPGVAPGIVRGALPAPPTPA